MTQPATATLDSGVAVDIKLTNPLTVTTVVPGTQSLDIQLANSATAQVTMSGDNSVELQVPGPQGAKGDRGTTWLSGAGVPAGALGNISDWYLRTNGEVYEKTGATTWVLRQNLTGPTGATGTAGSRWHTGAGAPATGLGVITDFYLNSTNSDYYEKTGASTWTLRGNIKGATGTLSLGTVTTGAAGTSVAITNTGTPTAGVFNFTIPRGDKGNTGTMSIGTVTTGAAGSSATVTNTGTPEAGVFNFTIPRGDTGATGPSGTIALGTVTTGAAGSSVAITNTGTASAAVFNFTIPRGDTGAKGDRGSIWYTGTTAPANGTGVVLDWYINTANGDVYEKTATSTWTLRGNIKGPSGTITLGTVTTGAPGSSVSITNSGTSTAAVFNFTIPRGDQGIQGVKGDTGTLSLGTVTTGAAGSSVSITNTGTPTAGVFNFTIPRGDKGDKGDRGTVALGTVTTGAVGTNVVITNTGTASDGILNFTIPRGAGVPTGGATGQYLRKLTGADFDTTWVDVPAPTNMVTTDTVQTITAAKTFSSAPIVPDSSFTIAKLSVTGTRNASTFLRGDGTFSAPSYPVTSVNTRTGAVTGLAEANAVVDLTTAQTVGGIKTFSSAPVVPDNSFTIAKTTGLQTALDSKYGLNASPTFTNLNASGTITVGSTTTGATNRIDFANSGVGGVQEFRFLRASDSAGMRVTEPTGDQILYEFYMSDNPDGGDYFSWNFVAWEGNGGKWEPLRIGGLINEYRASSHNFHGNITQATTPYYSANGTPNTVSISKTGTQTLTPNVSAYAGTSTIYWVRIDGVGTPNTFSWGTGPVGTTPIATLVPITGTAQALNTGVTVTFSSTTGGVVGDNWQFRANAGGNATFGKVTGTQIWEGANRVYSAANPPPATDLSNYVTLNSVQTVTAGKVFTATTEHNSRIIVRNDTTSTDYSTAQVEVRSGGTAAGSGKFPRISFHLPNVSALQIGADDTGLRTFSQAGTGLADFRAASLFDNGNRVYSASNPPPATDLSNYTTLSTAQTITGVKTFTARLNAQGRLRAGFNGQVSAATPHATSAAEFEISSNSMVAIGEMVAGDANPQITLYRTYGGWRQGSGLRMAWKSSTGPFAWQFGQTANNTTDSPTYGSETYVDLMTLSTTGALNTTGPITENGQRVYSANNKVPLAGLTATGTASSTTYLRGDNTWAPIPADSVTSVNSRTGNVTGLAEDNTVVHISGTETITGAKTFATAPSVPDASFTVAKIQATGSRNSSVYLSGAGTWTTPAAPSNMMTLNTSQTVAGAKSYTAPATFFLSTYISPTSGATSTTTTVDSPVINFRTNYWNGTASVGETADFYLARSSTTPGSHTFVMMSGLQVQGVINEYGNRVYSAANPPPAPATMVTTDTAQSITGVKTFTTDINLTHDLTERTFMVNNTGHGGYALIRAEYGTFGARTATASADDNSAWIELKPTYWNGSASVRGLASIGSTIDSRGSSLWASPFDGLEVWDTLDVISTQYSPVVSVRDNTTGTYNSGSQTWVYPAFAQFYAAPATATNTSKDSYITFKSSYWNGTANAISMASLTFTANSLGGHFNVDAMLREMGARVYSPNNKVKMRIPHTFTISGEVKVPSGDDNFIPGFFIRLPAGQTATYSGLRMYCTTGTVVYQVRRNGTNLFGGTTSATASTTPSNYDVGGGTALSDNDSIALVVSGVSGTPKNMSVTIFVDYSV